MRLMWLTLCHTDQLRHVPYAWRHEAVLETQVPWRERERGLKWKHHTDKLYWKNISHIYSSAPVKHTHTQNKLGSIVIKKVGSM